ncbi:WD40 repeat domain-containing protein, partial [Myxococcota bacterium]|nr:WD40 repeat domain-containing protein [Myxococcota bacterium]
MSSARRCLITLALCSSTLACAGAPIVPRLGVSLPPWPGGPMLVPQVGHAQRTKALAWAPDGRTFATGGEDGRVIVWDAASGAVRASFRAAAGQGVEAVAISPDGALVATSGGADFTHDDDPSVRVWDAATGELRHVLVEHRESVFGLAFASDGRLATAGKDGKVCLFDARAGRSLGCGGPRRIPGFLHWLKGDTEWAVRVAFTSDGGLAVAYAGGGLERYDASLSSLGFVAAGDHSVVSGMSTVIAGAASLAAQISDGSLVVWSLASPEPTRRASVPVPCDAYTSPCTLAFAPDGRTLALVRKDAVELFDAETLTRRHATTMAADGWGVAAWSVDGARLAFGTPKGLAIIDAKGALVHTWSPAVPRDRQVAFSPDGKLVYTSSGAWDLASGTFRTGAPPAGTFPVEERIAAYAIDEALVRTDYVAPPGPPRLAHGGSERIVALDASGAPIGVFAELEDMVFALAKSPDGTRVVAGDSDGRVYLFDAATRSRLWVRDDQSGYVWGVAFDRDGRRLASIDANGTVLVRDASSGAEQERYHLPGHWGSSGLAFSPDGRFLAVAASSIRVFRLADDAELVLGVLPVDGRAAPLAMTESGLFAGSDLAFSRVVFRVGPDLRTAELLSADQLFEQFHRPSLVADFFAGLAVAPSREALDVTGAPAVELVEELPAEVDGEKLRVRVRGLDRGAGVSEIRVFANGARVGGWPAGEGERGLKVKMVADVEVTLAPGDNVITAEAYSVRGRLRSPRLERVVRAKAAALAKPRLFVVSVALDDYADPAQPLSYAKADGAAVTAAFAKQRGRLFDDVLPTSIVDKA